MRKRPSRRPDHRCIALALLVALGACRARDDATKGKEEKPVPETGTKMRPAAVKIVYPAAPGSFVGLVQDARASVVHLKAAGPVTGGPDELFPGSEPGAALGTGFVVDRDGTILTNDHLISRAPEIRAVLADGTELSARVIGRDAKLDVALLDVDEVPALTPARLGGSENLQIGEWVVALGNPYGTEVTASAGIVSSLGKSDRDELVRPLQGATAYRSFLRTDAVITARNSGGPLVNMAGEVVGIATAVKSPAGSAGFAIPIDRALQILPMLKTDGVVSRAWLGVYIHPVDPERARFLKLPAATGALVSDVERPGPAADAGIEPGDVILKIGDKEVDHQTLPWLASTLPIGKPTPFVVWRDRDERNLNVIPIKTPD